MISLAFVIRGVLTKRVYESAWIENAFRGREEGASQDGGNNPEVPFPQPTIFPDFLGMEIQSGYGQLLALKLTVPDRLNSSLSILSSRIDHFPNPLSRVYRRHDETRKLWAKAVRFSSSLKIARSKISREREKGREKIRMLVV